jgi:hypothetical protein
MPEQSLITEPQRQPTGGALSLNTIGTMMSLAIEKGIDLKELVELHERLKRSAAEEAFNEAIQHFQAECPVIDHNETATVKSRKGDDASYSYTFASLPHIVKTIKPLLKECGLSYSFDSKVEKGLITVTCTIHHVMGHKRTSTFEAAASGAPGMSDIQKYASTITYGQRYALKLGLGLMTVDTDDDGRGSGDGSHENPEANEQAPRERPRAERNASLADKRKAAVAAVYDKWRTDPDHPDRKALVAKASKEERQAMFRNWARVVAQSETLDPWKPHEWTAAEDEAFKACELYFEAPPQ